MSQAAEHIARFNALQGKPVSRARLKEMLSAVNGVAGAEEVATRLAKALKALGGRKRIDRLEFTPIALQKPKAPVPVVARGGNVYTPPDERKGSIHAEASRKKKKLVVNVKKMLPAGSVKSKAIDRVLSKAKLSGVVQGNDLKNLSFKRIPLDGEYRQIFGPYIYSDTQIGIHGGPGHGKTVYLLKLAMYFAKRDLRTVYVSKEEFGRSTMTEKVQQFDFHHPNLYYAKKDLSKVKFEDYDVVILDSVNKLKMTLEDYVDFVEKHGPRIYVAVMQTTKAGDFKGGQEWEHEMDIFGEVVNRKLVLRKNRYDSSFAAKSHQMDMAQRIEEAKKRKVIRDQVKSATEKAPEENSDPLVG